MRHIQIDGQSPNWSDNNVGNFMRLVYNSITRHIDEGLAPLGLTDAQWRPLALIAAAHADTAVELASQIGVDTGAMTRTLNRLEQKGLIERHRCNVDKRVVRLSLTPKSRQLGQQIFQVIEDVLNHHFSCLSVDEFNTFVALQKKIIRHTSPEMAEAIEHYAGDANSRRQRDE